MNLTTRSAAQTVPTEFMGGRVDATLCDDARGLYAVASGPPARGFPAPPARLFLETVDEFAGALGDAVEAAHEEGWGRARIVFEMVFQKASDAIRGRYGTGQPASTSATLLVLRGGTAAVGHVGRTRAYALHGGRVLRLTHDHVGEDDPRRQAKSPTLAVEAQHTGPQALGQQGPVAVDGVSFRLVPGSTLVLVSEAIADVTRGSGLLAMAETYPVLDRFAAAVASVAAGRQRIDEASAVAVRVIPAAGAAVAEELPSPEEVRAAVEEAVAALDHAEAPRPPASRPATPAAAAAARHTDPGVSRAPRATRPPAARPRTHPADVPIPTSVGADPLAEDLIFLGRLDVFAGLSARDLRAVRQVARVARLQKGEVLFPVGAGTRCLYLATHGELAAFRDDKPVARIHTGRVLGETTLFAEGGTDVEVRAAGPCRVLVLTLEDLEGLVESRPETAALVFMGIIRRLGHRLMRSAGGAKRPARRPPQVDLTSPGLTAPGVEPG